MTKQAAKADGPEWQLFNLAEVPGESKNLAAANPDKVEELKKLLPGM